MSGLSCSVILRLSSSHGTGCSRARAIAALSSERAVLLMIIAISAAALAARAPHARRQPCAKEEPHLARLGGRAPVEPFQGGWTRDWDECQPPRLSTPQAGHCFGANRAGRLRGHAEHLTQP